MIKKPPNRCQEHRVPADITLVNLNMLFMRYGQEIERELHVPLGCLYLTRALEDAGFAVDFRDYQCASRTARSTWTSSWISWPTRRR